MPDLQLTCPECSEEFTFTEDEQAACAAQAFPPPTYCPNCYQSRKAAKSDARTQQRRGSHRRGRR
jgi:hypothetical protein